MVPGELDGLSEVDIVERLAAQPHAGLLPPVSPNGQTLEYRPAAVLVPLLWTDDAWQVLFTHRTDTVSSHKGQVSFPGGSAEPGDTGPEDTALRETYEEIGLLPDDVTIYGRLVSRSTISSYIITPIVARIPWPYPFRLSPDEVSRVFTIPLAVLAAPGSFEERPRQLPGAGLFEKVVYFREYNGELLWGISGRITVDLLKALRLIP